MPELPFLIPGASSFANSIDAVFWGITLVCLIFFIIVVVGVVAFAVRYRRGNRVNRTLPGHEGVALELTWTIIPLIIAMGIFVWSTSVYFTVIRPPKNTMNIYVVGKQWMWKLQHPTGRWEMNELHVPVGRPVKLTMISEDVIHDFGIPAFRVKMDVLPGRYTTMWFTPTRVGRYHIFCSEYCGTQHAIMGGYLTVMEPGDFERWMRTGNTQPTIASAGERKFRQYGCTGCHGSNSNIRAPSLEGIYNKPVAIEIPEQGNATQVINADDRYLHDSIILPTKEIAAGYQPIMPSYKGRLSEEEVIQIIEYIKTLGTSNGTSNNNARDYDTNRQTVTGEGITRSGSRIGDMSDTVDRERVIGSTSRAAVGGGVPDMSRTPERDLVMRGGANTGAGGLAEDAAGGLRQGTDRRTGLNVNTAPSYTSEAAEVISGIKSGNTGTGGTGANTGANAAR